MNSFYLVWLACRSVCMEIDLVFWVICIIYYTVKIVNRKSARTGEPYRKGALQCSLSSAHRSDVPIIYHFAYSHSIVL